ncbi:Ig-like domain-containing protein [Heyndrickxia oleronia]|uniref:Ig-like domain-containing protein n=1 Tax=Heyndrickxia oleronia TaxID=38875 RepID=A0AAW6SZC4_9BACI|nr:Ig-like domain-containing protein [Heyndrickxia oleronia]MDH5162031.1 Ig-like domain-containing protein [Heyndrickxia oleronia]
MAPEPVTVKVKEEVIMPKTVSAKMSDGTTKEVTVVWVPKSIDTSKAGTYTATGTVEGFKGTVTLTVVVEELEKGVAYISLYKDSTSSSDKVDFDKITNFYLKNQKTGEIFKEGKNYSGTRKNVFEMKNIPEGEYTIHFEMPEGMSVKEIQLGDSYKETIYHPDTNPLVIVDSKMQEKSYVKIVLKSEATLAEIKPLEDLTVPTDITLDAFKEALPKHTTIIDSLGKEHQVDINWDIRPANFETYKKNGGATLWSEFFTLPLSVSNTDPATRLKVTLKVTFENSNSEEQIAVADQLVKSASDALINLDTINNKDTTQRGFSKADADNVQKLIDEARTYVNGLVESKEKDEFSTELDQIQTKLTEKINARYVYYEEVEEETNINQFKFKVSADFWKAGNVERIAQNKAIIISKAADGAVLVKYSPLGSTSWNIPAAGDKWETTLRFNGGVRTLALNLTNNGDGTWNIESDWLVEKGNKQE